MHRCSTTAAVSKLTFPRDLFSICFFVAILTAATFLSLCTMYTTTTRYWILDIYYLLVVGGKRWEKAWVKLDKSFFFSNLSLLSLSTITSHE